MKELTKFSLYWIPVFLLLIVPANTKKLLPKTDGSVAKTAEMSNEPKLKVTYAAEADMESIKKDREEWKTAAEKGEGFLYSTYIQKLYNGDGPENRKEFRSYIFSVLNSETDWLLFSPGEKERLMIILNSDEVVFIRTGQRMSVERYAMEKIENARFLYLFQRRTSVIPLRPDIELLKNGALIGFVIFLLMRFFWSIFTEDFLIKTQIPGASIIRIAELLPEKYRATVRQEIADMRTEYYEALAEKKRLKAEIIVTVYYLGMGWSLVRWLVKEFIGPTPKAG